MPNQNGTGFPSMSDLLFLKSMNALTPDQVKVYYEGNAINAQQATQLGYKPVNMANPAQNNQTVNQNKVVPNSQAPSVNPQVNPNTNPTK